MTIMCTQGQLDADMMCQVLKRLSALMHHWKNMKRKDVPKMAEKAVLAFISETSFSDLLGRSEVQTFRGATLAYIVKALPRTLKCGNVNQLTSEAMLLVTFHLLKAYDISDTPCLQEVLVLCLKFGVGAVDDALSPTCLEIARYIITSVYSQSQGIEKIELLRPHQIHSMVLSHSNFDSLAGTNSKTRTELLSLLTVCLALNQGSVISLDQGKIARLLAAFRASVADEDRLLRRLLFLYETNNELDEVSLQYPLKCFIVRKMNSHLTHYFFSGSIFFDAERDLGTVK